MTVNHNIPVNAVKVKFNYSGHRGTYYVWESPRKTWQWHAIDAEGEEVNQDKAMSAASQWIINDRQSKIGDR